MRRGKRGACSCGMFDYEGLRTETLTDLQAFTGSEDIGEEVCGRVSAPPDDLHLAFNANQIASKTWLLDRVYETLGGRFDTVYILGAWYGALATLIFDDARYQVGRIFCYDLNPDCAPVAERVNANAVGEGRFRAATADAGTLCYPKQRAGPKAPRSLIINTSCEHMPPSVDWFSRIPENMYMALQSNDYFDCDEHVNCVPDLAAFKAQVPLKTLCYEGTLRRRRYSRFMLIGKK